MPMEYAKTWEQIDDMILNSDDLGLRLNDHSPLASELKEAKIEDIADLRQIFDLLAKYTSEQLMVKR